MKYFFYIAVFLFVSLSCSSNHDYDDEYDKFISDLEQVTIQDSTRFEFGNSPIYKPHDIVSYSNGKSIVVDASNWTLHLMNEQGDFLDETGRKGRGPNEYSVINQIHRGSDNRIYVYDAVSQDITIYEIADNQFLLESEIALPAYEDGLFLKSIYKTSFGFIGVFKQGVGSRDEAEQTFKVYRLGADLQLQTHLFDMPGNETYTSERGFQQETPMGSKTIWGMADGLFYYSRTNDFSINAVNIGKGDTTLYDFSDVPRPVKGEEEIKAIETRIRPIIQAEPQMKELIREGQYLPHFIDFMPAKNYFYYTLFRPSASYGLLLRINKATKEMKKIIVPYVFNIYAANGNTLYGIDHTADGAPEIMILKLAS